jgi:class 3 adenylate cyclase
VQLQEQLRTQADRLRLEKGLSFSVRIGLNSGEVVVGSIGDDLRMEYTAQGTSSVWPPAWSRSASPGASI